MPGQYGQQSGHDPNCHEQDSARGRRARLLLVRVGELVLNHLPGAQAAKRSDPRRIEHEADRKRNHERTDVEDQAAVSSFTSSSRRTPWDALTSTRSPSVALRRTQSAAAARSGTTSAPAAWAMTFACCPSTTQTASNTSAARCPT